MPYKDFSVGEILTSSDVDTYLMSQVIIRCTSSTRPSSPAEGWHIYETDTDLTQVYNGTTWVPVGGWLSYTPTVYQGTSTISSGLTKWGRYRQNGNLVEVYIRVRSGGFTGTSDQIAVSAPVDGYAPTAPNITQGEQVLGTFQGNAVDPVPACGVILPSARDRFKIYRATSTPGFSSLAGTVFATSGPEITLHGAYLTSA